MKKAATKEQRDKIFKIDKQKQYIRKKKQKKRKALENKLRKRKEAQDQCTCSINGTGINNITHCQIHTSCISLEPDNCFKVIPHQEIISLFHLFKVNASYDAMFLLNDIV